jgi:hypothetical protein
MLKNSSFYDLKEEFRSKSAQNAASKGRPRRLAKSHAGAKRLFQETQRPGQ